MLTANFLTINPNHILGHYRSKLYVNHFTSNPILAAASPLLSLLERINLSKNLPPIQQLHANIEHELTAFYCRLTNKNYSPEIFSIAQYLITATTDELIAKNYMKNNTLVAFKAFTPATTDNTGPELRFFDLLELLKSQPIKHLDLLELAYYCLISGFEGMYHTDAKGRQKLENTIEELFQILVKNRKYKNIKLLRAPTISNIKQPFNKGTIISVMILLTTIVGIYIGSDNMLDNKAKTIFMKTSLWTER